MHFTLSTIIALATATAGVAAKGYPTSDNPYPNPALQLQKREAETSSSSLVKRTFDSNGCFLGILCFGTSSASYASDVNNCGSKGNRCKTTWPNGGSGAKCSNGVCGAAQCSYNLWDFNWLNFGCQDVSSDTSNCGKCGQTCSPSDVDGSTATKCVAGSCTATACKQGYSLNSGVCTSCPSGWAWNGATKKCQDVSSDMNNCGAIGALCTIARGNGKCQNGQCLVDSCRSNCFNLGNNQCTELDVQNDDKNCGRPGNDCTGQYSNGVGACRSGSCYLKGCNNGYKANSSQNCLLFWCNAPTETCTQINMDSDMDNCGSPGNKCPTSDGNGSNCRCSAKQCWADCNRGYTWDPQYKFCRRTDNDVNHCGGCGNSCPSDKGTPVCNSGTCSYSSCKNPFTLVNGQCANINTQTDPNNCGSVGKVCKLSDYSNANSVQCSASTCVATCQNGFDWDPVMKNCRNVQNDDNNCGSCGKTCANAFPNGQAKCQNGQCTLIKCNDNYERTPLDTCALVDTNTNVNACGPAKVQCKFPLGQGVCRAGQCTYTSCQSPLTLSSSNTCINTGNDPNNCGGAGKKCGPYPNSLNPTSLGQCNNGACTVTCKPGYDFDTAGNFCRPVDSDPQHCGRCGNSCNIAGAAGSKCQNGQCYPTWCLPGYRLSPDSTQCIPITASQKANSWKRSKVTASKSLCPDQETACPIAGAASFATALNHHFSAFADLTTGMESTAGGYECLDTKTSLDSCGGCASTGEGQDCTKIRGAVGVTCAESACVVLSCEAGWRPNIASTKCVRAHHDSHNSTKAHGARRHLSARHGHHS